MKQWDVLGIDLTFQYSNSAEDGMAKARRAVDDGVGRILQRLKQYGPNVLAEGEKEPRWRAFGSWPSCWPRTSRGSSALSS